MLRNKNKYLDFHLQYFLCSMLSRDVIPAGIHGLLNKKKVKKLKQREERKRMLRKAKDYIVYSSTE